MDGMINFYLRFRSCGLGPIELLAGAHVPDTLEASVPRSQSAMKSSKGCNSRQFSLEIVLESDIPSYTGGLGVLAGDTMRFAADLAVPMVAVTLVSRNEYFHQRLDSSGRQPRSRSSGSLKGLPARAAGATLGTIEGRSVHLRAWRYEVEGAGAFQVPVYSLGQRSTGKLPWNRSLTDFLYGGDSRCRLCQGVVPGL